MIKLFDHVKLKNGIQGAVVEILGGGKAYMIDYKTEDGGYDVITVNYDDLEAMIVEVEEAVYA
jgi:hypothetical protein